MSTEDICIIVKTYPTASTKYRELVCCGGINKDGQWRRLYPVPFRRLPEYHKFRKYEWITVDVIPSAEDRRPESRRPDLNSMDRSGLYMPSSDDWRARMALVYDAGVSSLEELDERRKAGQCSMGTVRASEVHDMTITPAHPEKAKRWRNMQSQVQLPGLEEEFFRLLEPLPYDFRYVFSCDDPSCKTHQIITTDWEVGALFWRLARSKSHLEAAERVREKFLNDIARPGNSVHFFMGTIHRFGSWLVGGVAYPPQSTVDAVAHRLEL